MRAEPAARAVRVVRVALPGHLARLAGLGERGLEVAVALPAMAGPAIANPGASAPEGDAATGVPTVGALLEALERAYPALQGVFTERAPDGAMRLRPYLRVFGAAADLTPAGLGAPLPPEVLSGSAALRIVGAIAGG